MSKRRTPARFTVIGKQGVKPQNFKGPAPKPKRWYITERYKMPDGKIVVLTEEAETFDLCIALITAQRPGGGKFLSQFRSEREA